MRNQFITFLLFILLANIAFSEGITHPKIKWAFKTQGTIRGTSVISGTNIYFGSADGFLYALNKNDGSLLWKWQTKGAIAASPAVAGNSVFLVSRDHYFYSINKITGRLNWKFKAQPSLPASYGGWDYFMAAPVVNGNEVLVSSGDGYIYSLNRRDGNLVWKFKTNGRIRATPLIYNDVLYQPSNDGYLYAIKPETGKLLWKFATKGITYNSKDFGFDRLSIFTQPLIKGNLLILGSRDGNVYAIDLKSHREKWAFNYGTTWAMGIAVSEGLVYANWSTNNLTCAINLDTGKEAWQFKCDGHNYTTPLIIDSSVYIGSGDGKVYRLNKYTGEKEWDYDLGKEVFSSPKYDSNTLYFGCDNGYFYAMDDGQKVYKAVYEPLHPEGNLKYYVADKKLTPYLVDKGFQQIDSTGLYQFISARIADGKPSVIVFSLFIIPNNIIGKDPSKGMIRQYLNKGGKIVWLGDIPNYYAPDDSGNIKLDTRKGEQLLGVHFKQADDSGNFFSSTAQEGRNMGLPTWFTTTAAPVNPEDVVPLAFDEYGRVSAWIKKFNSKPGSGWVSCRSWSWNLPMQNDDLKIIYQLATYGLD